jgi:predicted ribonuclease YlaK
MAAMRAAMSAVWREMTMDELMVERMVQLKAAQMVGHLAAVSEAKMVDWRGLY